MLDALYNAEYVMKKHKIYMDRQNLADDARDWSGGKGGFMSTFWNNFLNKCTISDIEVYSSWFYSEKKLMS